MITSPGRQWLIGALVILVLIAWWAVLMHQAEASIFTRVPMLDEQQYLAEAQYYSHGRLQEHAPGRPFFMSPLYPRLLTFLQVGGAPADKLVFPVGFFRAVHWFQIFLWLASVVLLRLTAGRLFAGSHPGSWLLWLPSALFIFYGPLAIYTMMVLVEMPLVFLVTLLLYLLSAPPKHWTVSGAMGLVLGLSVLLRGSMVILVPLVILLLWRCQGPDRKRLLHLGAFLVICAAVLAPPVIYNSRLTGHLSAPSLNGGLNLYLGNGPEATGLSTSLPGDWLDDPAGTAELARRLQKESVTVAEADQLWRQLATEAMAEDPLRTMGLGFRKLHLQTQLWEMDQVTSLIGWHQEVPLLKVLFLPWWVLVIPAVWAVFPKPRIIGRHSLYAPLGMLISLMAVQSLFFVVSRYRMVLLPALCLLALAGVLEAWRMMRSTRVSRLATIVPAAIVLVVSILMVIPWGLASVRTAWEPLTMANHAQRWAVLGSVQQDSTALEKSADIYQESFELWPEQSGPYLGYAAVLRELNRPNDADDILQQGIQRVSVNVDLRRALIAAHLAANRTSQALEAALRLLRDHPTDAETLHNATVIWARSGEPDKAEAMARRLMVSHPSLAQGYVDLGILLARAGKREQAREVFEEGLRVNPGHRLLSENLSRVVDSR